MHQPGPALGRPLFAASRPVPVARQGRAQFGVQGPRRAKRGRSAQRCPPAAARGLHPRSSVVRRALPGCSPSVLSGRSAAAGPECSEAVRPAGGHLFLCGGALSREPDRPDLCPAGGVRPWPHAIFPPPPRFRESTVLASSVRLVYPSSLLGAWVLCHFLGSKSYAYPSRRQESSTS